MKLDLKCDRDKREKERDSSNVPGCACVLQAITLQLLNSCMMKLAEALERKPLAVSKPVEDKSLHVFSLYEDKQFFKILDQVVLRVKKGKAFWVCFLSE